MSARWWGWTRISGVENRPLALFPSQQSSQFHRVINNNYPTGVAKRPFALCVRVCVYAHRKCRHLRPLHTEKHLPLQLWLSTCSNTRQRSECQTLSDQNLDSSIFLFIFLNVSVIHLNLIQTLGNFYCLSAFTLQSNPSAICARTNVIKSQLQCVWPENVASSRKEGLAPNIYRPFS